MTKHNALRMLGRSGNPTLSDATFAGFETVEAKTMTLQGTVNKVGILLALVVGGALFTWNQYYSTGSAGFLMPVGLFGGMIFAVITMFRPTLAMYTAPIYAILQGLFLGGISAAFESMYPGIVISSHRPYIWHVGFFVSALQNRCHQTHRELSFDDCLRHHGHCGLVRDQLCHESFWFRHRLHSLQRFVRHRLQSVCCRHCSNEFGIGF